MAEPARDVRIIQRCHYLLAGQRPPPGLVADECERCGAPVSLLPVAVPVLAVCLVCYDDVLEGVPA